MQDTVQKEPKQKQNYLALSMKELDDTLKDEVASLIRHSIVEAKWQHPEIFRHSQNTHALGLRTCKLEWQ